MPISSYFLPLMRPVNRLLPKIRRGRHVNSQSGFTLIELSIVLVIIGLLIGGILVGKDLVRSAEIHSTAKDIERLQASINTFRLKYQCLPGDCPNATNFFGTYASCPSWAADFKSGTCNGNGDNQYTPWASESAHASQQLVMAALWPANAVYAATFNMKIAAPSVSTFAYIFTDDLYGQVIAAQRNTITLAAMVGGNASAVAFLTIDAQSIDQKVDDGVAITGKLRGIRGADQSGALIPCVSGSNYDLSKTILACRIMIYW